MEWKLLLYMISRIKRYEILFLYEKIPLKEFAGIMGVSTTAVVKRTADTLANKEVVIKEKIYKLFEELTIKDRTIVYMFNAEMRKHLLGLNDNMTIFELGRIYEMKSKYTIRMYLFGMSFRFMTYYNCEDNDFKKLIGFALPKSELERRMLFPALEELNKNTNIFLHARHKDGRYYFAAAEKTEKQKIKYGVELWKNQIADVRDFGEISKELFADLDFNKL